MAPLGEFLFYKEIEMKKMFFIFVVLFFLLAGCQANYIRDVQGGTVAPSSTSTLTGIAEH